MSLRSKMVLLFLPLFLFCAGLLLWLSHRAVHQALLKEVKARGLWKLEAMAAATAAGFRDRDEQKLLPGLQSGQETAGGAYAMALDPSGLVLAHTNVIEKGRRWRDAEASRVLASDRPVFRVTQLDGAPVLDISFPVWARPKAQGEEEFLFSPGPAARGSKLGILRMGIALKETLGTEARIFRRILGIALGTGILFLGMSLLLLRRILRPIRLMSQATAKIGRREYEVEVPVDSSDELGALARNFNSMSRALAQSTVSREELERKMAELARSNSDLEQFAYVASHDLQEPLRKVASYAELLARRHRGRLDPEADKFIDYILGGVARMRALIVDLLTYSRAGRLERGFSRVDTGVVLNGVLENLEATIRESGAEISHGPLPSVAADSVEMTQLFGNLVGNAIKFRGPSPPRVRVECEARAQEWLFSVRDNGIGIDPRYAEQIFVIFKRLHARSEYPGTGIGLALAKKIVERAGGRIWVESQLGRGSVFYFTWPMEGADD
ncbi:MAG: HAMP domain-containing protein [Elusimicrobia bacterium]|nr:HAMP domain-containing protein [Elusimicrobiota bacterium]